MKKLAVALILLLLWGVNCTKPTGPISTSGDIVYVITERYYDGYSRIFFIDTESDSVVDSILTTYQIYGLGVSDDGSTLYIGISGLPFNGIEIDTKTKATKDFGPNTGVPIPKSRLLVNPVTYDFYDAVTRELVYKADSLTPTFSSPVSSGRHFDPKRKLFYGTLPNQPGKIGVFDYRSFKLVKIIDTQFSVADLAVTYAGNKLYYSLGPYFSGIDLEGNKAFPVYIFGNGISYLGIKPNDEYIYKTDLGGELHLEPIPSGLIGVYSPVFEKPLGSIDTRAVEQESPCFPPPGQLYTDQIAFSPDGKKAYISTWIHCLILVVDTESNKIIKTIKVEFIQHSLVAQKR